MRPAALARLLRGELRGRRLRSMALFVVVIALASAALVGRLEGQTKASDRWDSAFAEANGAHVTVDGDAAAVAEVARLPEVASSTRTYPRSATDLELLRGGEAVTTAFVRAMAADDLPGIARPLLRDGDWAAAGADDEIVIDRAFGLDEGIAVGEQLAVATPAGPRTFTVVGRAIDLIDCFYPSCDPVTVWLDPAGFEQLTVDTVATSFLRLRDPDAVDGFIAGLGDRPVGTQGWIDTRDDTLAVYEIFGAFLGAFGVFVMIAAAVVVAGSMATRAVARRRTSACSRRWARRLARWRPRSSWPTPSSPQRASSPAGCSAGSSRPSSRSTWARRSGPQGHPSRRARSWSRLPSSSSSCWWPRWCPRGARGASRRPPRWRRSRPTLPAGRGSGG